VTVTNLTFQLSDGDTETGIFTNAVGGTLNLSGGTFYFTTDSTVAGAGNFTVSGGTATSGGGINVTGTFTVNRPAWTANGFNLAVSGPVGSNYTVLLSTNLLQTNWSLLTSYVSTFTKTSVIDTNATKFDTNRLCRAYMHKRLSEQ
jgi:hypothetical protein